MISDNKCLRLDLHGFSVKETRKILRMCFSSLLKYEFEYAFLIHGYRNGHVLRDMIWRSIRSGDLFGLAVPVGCDISIHGVKGNPGASVVYIPRGDAS